MVRIILLQNLCGQHGPYYITVESMWTTCQYYIIVKRMWTTWFVAYYCRTYVGNMVRIILLQNVCGQDGPYYIILERMQATWLYYIIVERM